VAVEAGVATGCLTTFEEDLFFSESCFPSDKGPPMSSAKRKLAVRMEADSAAWENESVTQVLADILTPERASALHALAAEYGVKDLRVFGSYARGEAGPESDLDLLVNIDYGRGVAMRLVHFCEEASKLVGMKVDVVTEDGLDPRLHARIFREARPF